MRGKAECDRGLPTLVRELQAIGFTEYEARALLALMNHSPATAYEIGKLAGLPRPNAYNVLDALAQKMAVQPVSQNPVRYVPVAPRLLLKRIAKTTNDRCESLARKLAGLKGPQQSNYVWSLDGNSNVHDKIEEMIARARRHIWIKSDIQHLNPHVVGLRRASERGVAVVVVLFGEMAVLNALDFGTSARIYPHEGNGVAVAMSDYLLTLTVDFKEALTAAMREGGYGVYTENLPVVTLVESLIRHEIYLAEISSASVRRSKLSLDH